LNHDEEMSIDEFKKDSVIIMKRGFPKTGTVNWRRR
jgi:hypothetical protein